ncbi:OmpA family protein [Verrucomicrobiales bacterium]|nr:OmpA family protein [Verrucomicrobiales bacterium]
MKIVFGLVFIALVALCTFLTQPIYRARMEEDLLSKTRAILDEEGLEKIEVAVVRHELQLTPQADAEPDDLIRAIEVSDQVWGAYLPSAPAPQPVLGSASLVGTEKADGVLELRGELPDESIRSEIVAAAETIPGVSRVDDQLVVAADIAEPTWGKDVSGFLNNIVIKADSAKLSINDSGLQISGVVDSDESKAELGRLAATIPNGEAPLLNELTVEPWADPSLRLQRRGKQLILTGVLPDEATRQAMLEQAKAAAGDSEVIDRTTLAKRTREPWWSDHASAFVPRFFNRSKGPAFVDYSAERMKAESIASNAKSRRELINLGSKGLPIEIEPSIKVSVVEDEVKPIAMVEPKPEPVPVVPAKPQTEFKQLAVYFNTSSSYVQSKETSKVEQAAQLIKSGAFAGTNLTVGGYADLRGNAESNRNLSLERANAVRKKLIELGVPAERLSVEFFGEDTSEVAAGDLWKSRRVEISVQNTSDQ